MKTHDEIIRDVAAQVGTDPAYLDALINFETGGTYDPFIKNPRSSARGLIQIIDKTAQDIFNAQDSLALVNAHPTFESQMYGVVLPYLKKYAPFPTKQSLYMSVFYPAYRYVPEDQKFPSWVPKNNPGIYTPADYIAFVDKRIKNPVIVQSSIVLVAIVAGAAFAFAKYRGII